MGLDKRAVIERIRAEIAREVEVISRAARSAHEAATHEESRPENDKDTRGLEAAYLAGAQAERARELERMENALAFLVLRKFEAGEPIALSALIEAQVDGASQVYFLAPVGGGMRVRVEQTDVLVITPQSPMGQALVGRAEGDVVELRARQGVREVEIRNVS